MIELFRPCMGEAEAQALRQVLESGWLGAGSKARELEARWQALCGSGYCVSVHNATEGLFQAVELLRPGCTVVMPAIHFIGAAQAVLATGRRLELVDVDERTLMVTPEALDRGKHSRKQALLLLHYSAPADVEGIAQAWDGAVIEDAAAACLARRDGTLAGTFGSVGVWSFDAMKPIAAGDGGMVWCRYESQADLVRAATRLGMEDTHGCKREGRWWELSVKATGRLSEMNDLAAALALAQLDRAGEMQAQRHAIAGIYRDGLGDLDWLRLKPELEGDVDYLFWVQLEKRDRLARFLRERGVYTSFRYWPLHWALGLGGHYPHAERAAQTTLLLPCHAAMTKEQAWEVVRKVRAFSCEC